MMEKHKVTSTQLAQRLGISRSTVSRALSGYPHVDEDVRQRVLKLADELNYRPNQAARSLAKGESLLVGVVLYSKPEGTGELSGYVNELLKGVQQAERRYHDYGLTVETVITDISRPDEQIEAVDALVKRGARAIAISPCVPEVVAPTIDRLMENGIQVLLINTDVPQSRRLCYIGSDYVQAGRISAELIGSRLRGRGRVAAIAFSDTGTMIPQKLTGFREELARYPDIEILGPYKFSRVGDHVYEDTLAMLQAERPDAVYMTYGQLDDVARAVYDSGLAGRTVLVGFDTSPSILSLLRKRVISAVITQGPAQQGNLCVQILYEYLARGVKPRSSVVHARLEIVTSQNSVYYRDDSLNVFTYNYQPG
ncbi:MAG TPA: LacI family DNA-binding transcriptional regulator [Candidatus Fimadaptatus faecigallinarum]|uniref:LacI family DNA-binding transcriptional regulator n=1 Tax=Candidatus Fimadaptatus faecigallinarum TaxID=2840814 RepID=A0A9D1LQX8_9FIRM|nr:LacI family DNA-binding transcriptional regulator [Candidatus Fimadaptatus faecigallinarum]